MKEVRAVSGRVRGATHFTANTPHRPARATHIILYIKHSDSHSALGLTQFSIYAPQPYVRSITSGALRFALPLDACGLASSMPGPASSLLGASRLGRPASSDGAAA